MILYGRAFLNGYAARGNNIAVLLLLQWRVAVLLKRTMPPASLALACLYDVMNTFVFYLSFFFRTNTSKYSCITTQLFFFLN